MIKSLILFNCLLIGTAFAACKGNDIGYDGHCYHDPGSEGDNMNYHQASSYCKNKGYTLPVFNTREQEKFYIQKMVEKHGMGYSWIGLEVNGIDFNWQDCSGLWYTNFATNNPSYKHNCVMNFFIGKTSGLWNMDWDCTKDTALFYCQYRENNPQKDDCPVRGTDCISVDEVIGNHCYMLTNFDGKSYQSMQSYCEGQQKSLAVIETQEQNDWIKGSGPVWIGLYRDPSDNKFYWPGKQPVHYTNWANGVPSDHSKRAVYIRKDGKWDVKQDNSLLSAMCSGNV